MNPRANTYRRLHDIPASWGTAVNVQAMVFGNMGNDCATGVCFTRDPSTGENIFYGEFLVNAQGEDVVAGIRTPQPLSKLKAKPGEVAMEEALPECVRRSCAGARRAGKPLQGHAGYRIHCAAKQAVYAGKRVAASAPRLPRCASQWKWRKRGLIDRSEAVKRVNHSLARSIAASNTRS